MILVSSAILFIYFCLISYCIYYRSFYFLDVVFYCISIFSAFSFLFHRISTVADVHIRSEVFPNRVLGRLADIVRTI